MHNFSKESMSPAPSRHLVGARLFVSVLTGLMLAGCTEHDSVPDPACGGNGELHEDHCHCDPGFVLSDDELSCLPEQDSGDDDHDTGDHDTSDDHSTGDTGDTDTDTGDTGDTGEDDEFVFEPSDTRAATGTADDSTQIWMLEAVDGDVLLGLEIYESFGGPTSPGVVDITDVETNYATCGTCLIFRTGCTAHGDHFHCERTFMPRAEGQVQLDAIGAKAGEPFTGELRELVFQEVTIAEDFQTHPVTDGEVLHLNAWAFDVLLDALGTEEECGGHGHMHGDHCHCDPGYQLDPEDPTLCIPE